MSFQAMSWAVKQTAGNPLTKAVLMALANYADDQGACFPGQARLAAETEQGERTIRRKIEELESKGLLTVTRRQTKGLRTSDHYQLLMNKTEPARVAARVGANRPTTTTEPARVAAIYKDEPLVEPLDKNKPRTRKLVVYSDEFETSFWKPYPDKRNASKLEAWGEWQKLAPEDRAKAVVGVAAYAGHCRLNNWYRPLHPHRFLKTRRFEAEFDRPQVISIGPKRTYREIKAEQEASRRENG